MIGEISEKSRSTKDDIAKIIEKNGVDNILKNENAYFNLPDDLANLFVIDARDFFYETNYADVIKNPSELLIKVFRSKKWKSDNPKDAKFKHGVVYYTTDSEIYREYLPEELAVFKNNEWENLKNKYHFSDLDQRDKVLTRKFLIDKNISQEEKNEHKEIGDKKNEILEEFQKLKRAILLVSPLIEKKIVTFKNPLVISGYNYDERSTFSREGIFDMRYITEGEINRIEKKGHDGIIFEQYGWFIVFK